MTVFCQSNCQWMRLSRQTAKIKEKTGYSLKFIKSTDILDLIFKILFIFNIPSSFIYI